MTMSNSEYIRNHVLAALHAQGLSRYELVRRVGHATCVYSWLRGERAISDQLASRVLRALDLQLK